MPEASSRGLRRSSVIETVVCAAIVTLIAIHAVWRMDYLDAEMAHTVRMTDNSRTAYVAKNIADGNGYTTNDLPASLVDFYDERGKLHDSRWENADRFPFTAYAIAGLYKVTGSTSWEVGILLYNLICWVGFLVVLYRLARTIWGDRYSALFAVGLALLHPYTYMYMYWKDSDMLLLTAGCLSLLFRYFRDPPEALGWKYMIAIGTLLAWSFLSRPNLGGSFIIFFAGVALHRAWRGRRSVGLKTAARDLLRREGVAALVAIVWILPFAIHSYGEWGSPLFSANGIYQLPLGTRFGMGTDTWWKYTEPHHAISLGNLLDDAPGDVAAKFTSSWLVTLKFCLRSYAIELFLACGLALWLGRRAAAEPAADPTATRPVRMIAWLTAFAVIMNLALLPLYSYQNFNWRHYIGFGLPMLWLAAGHAIYRIGVSARPFVTRATTHIRGHAGAYVLALVVPIVVWNFGSKGPEGNALFVRTSQFVGAHWLTASLVLLGLLAHRFVLRGNAYSRVVAVTIILVIARYQPHFEMKHSNAIWFPATDRVAKVLRERRGIVSSLALQGEVAWMSDRKNIPAPELVAHLYSYAFDHELEIEDVYLESADALLAGDGPFGRAAPGFEGYARLQRFRGPLPGYELVFHESTFRSYPKFKIKSRPKASSVYRLVDREAVKAFGHTPAQIDLGDVRNVVYTAHGFGDYFAVEGRSVVAATDITRKRYGSGDDQPFEDTSVTFFVDDHVPRAIEIEIYGLYPTTIELYWNLDLFQYDRPVDRAAHLLGSEVIDAPGWHKVHLDIPPGLIRRGVNKLGLKPASYRPFVVCPPEVDEAMCLQMRPHDDKLDWKVPAYPLRLAGATGVTNQNISMLVGTLQFLY